MRKPASRIGPTSFTISAAVLLLPPPLMTLSGPRSAMSPRHCAAKRSCCVRRRLANCRLWAAFPPMIGSISATSPQHSSPGTRANPRAMDRTTLPTARWFFLPLVAASGGLASWASPTTDDRLFARTDRRLLDALVDQIALALERLRLTEELSETRLASETEPACALPCCPRSATICARRW